MKSSVNIDAAITQWNSRAGSEWRTIRAGRWRALGLHGVGLGGVALAMRRQHHVAGVRDEERDAGEERRPQQIPRDVREDRLVPGVAAPGQDVHVPASTPRIARFTRFRISGTL